MKKTSSLAALFLVILNGCAVLGSPATTIICQTADVATTIVALEKGAVETNPLMAGVLDKLGYTGFIAIKVLLALVLIDFVRRSPTITPAVAAVNVVTCAAAIHNIGVINGL